ncbi:MAG: nuclear transport factor 2 family protein [Thermodesulfobacteriota bacterium]
MSRAAISLFIKNIKSRICEPALRSISTTTAGGMLICSALFAAAVVPDATDVANLKLQNSLKAVPTFVVAEAIAQSEEETDNMEDKNKEIVREGFAKWANGTGSFFDLLTEDAEWTITGRSPISKTYTSRQQFLDEAITPINERLSAGIVPTVRGIYADGDMVIALWDGTATAKDGKPYKNTYSWYMTMKDGRIVKVVAFFDAIEFMELWERVSEK